MRAGDTAGVVCTLRMTTSVYTKITARRMHRGLNEKRNAFRSRKLCSLSSRHSSASSWRRHKERPMKTPRECRAVTSISSQRLPHKMTNLRAALMARLHVRQDLSQVTRYLASKLTDESVQCTFHNLNCALGQGSLNSR